MPSRKFQTLNLKNFSPLITSSAERGKTLHIFQNKIKKSFPTRENGINKGGRAINTKEKLPTETRRGFMFYRKNIKNEYEATFDFKRQNCFI